MTSRWSETVGEHRLQQRERILSSALELLGERGMASLTMSALAERSQMSRPTLYHYFPDVEAVLSAWVSREIEASVTALVDEAAAITDPLARLWHLVRAQCRLFASQEHRLGADHFESEAGSPAIRRAVGVQMEPLRSLLADTMMEARARGALRDGVEASVGADMLLGMLGALRRRLVAGTLEADEAVAAITDLLGSGWLCQGTPGEPEERPQQQRGT